MKDGPLIDSQIQKEAIDWFVRLRSDQATEQDQAEFAAWLTLGESHQAAYDLVKKRWASMGAAENDVEPEFVFRKSYGRPVSAALIRLGAVATLAVVVVSAWLVFDTSHPTYKTAVGEQRRVLLADDSSVHLNTDTEIQVAMSTDHRKIILEKGEVLCDVAENPDRPFTVIAGETEVVALGTLFSVYKAKKNTRVTVVEGRVSVTSNSSRFSDTSSRQIVVNPGEQAIVPRDPAIAQSTIPVTKPITIPEWDKGLLVFDQTPLDEVVYEIARYFPGELRLGSDVPDQPVTGTFKLRDRNVLLETLSESYSLSVVELNGTTLLVSKK